MQHFTAAKMNEVHVTSWSGEKQVCEGSIQCNTCYLNVKINARQAHRGEMPGK